ncbi:MAG: twin-arginine translocation signal domain-containing protein, partial [Terriglobia bacterium]
MGTSRRSFLKTVGVAGSLGLSERESLLSGFSESRNSDRIWDVHGHLHSVPGDSPEARMARLIQFADRVGIQCLILSQG